MDKRRLDDERRRLQREMEAAIEQVRASFRLCFDAIDRAERLLESGGDDQPPTSIAPAAAEPTGSAPEGSDPDPGSLRRHLARFLAGLSEPFGLEDVQARFPGVAPGAIRTCLARMARDGEVKIVQPGGEDQPAIYEVPEPRYEDVPIRDRGDDPG